MQLSEFDFDLPSELIARYPTAKRSDSRLFCVAETASEPTVHRTFSDITQLIEPGDLLVFNDTRVIPARLFGKKQTGGRVECLLERLLNDREFLAQCRASKSLKVDDRIHIADDLFLHVLTKQDGFYRLRLETKRHITLLEFFHEYGHIPLPPYMQRDAEPEDSERYQTVYAKEDGSVAAPTAGLHFDEALLNALRERGVNMASLTLHVGAGTFLPVRVDDLTSHVMHAEYIVVSEALCEAIRQTKRAGRRVIAVGTTTLRALESASRHGHIEPFEGETRIFIYPGFDFHCVDVLITNFHLPESTLLMLVCALGGHANIMAAYREAVNAKYRFYSYGDAMWVARKTA